MHGQMPGQQLTLINPAMMRQGVPGHPQLMMMQRPTVQLQPGKFTLYQPNHLI